jgi:hypothetical protein
MAAMEQQGTFGTWQTAAPDDIEHRPVASLIYGGSQQTLDAPVGFMGLYQFSPEEATKTGMAELELWLALVDGRYVIHSVQATGPEGQGLDIEALRRVNFSKAVRRLTRQVLGFHHFPHGEDLDDIYSQQGWLRARAKKAGQPTEPTMAEQVAYFYTVARLLGDHPTKAVAEGLGISADAAAQRVRRARQAGLIQPLASEQKVSG